MSQGAETETAERLRIAREFKAKTCGRHLTSDVFGEPEPEWILKVRPHLRTTPNSSTREYQRQYHLNRRINEARQKQKEQDGTYGVTRDWHTDRQRVQFRAHVGVAKVYACAIDAAEHRNAVMKQKYPEIPEFQIALEAVWRKWGCNCGKHRRPESCT